MRVTEHATNELFRKSFATTQERLQTAIQQVSSGRRLNQASDDPVASAAIARIRSSTARQEAFLAVGSRLEAEFGTADGAILSASNIMASVRETAMMAATGPRTQIRSEALAIKVASLKESLLDVANTKHEGHYIFGGVTNDAPPFGTDGAYRGSDVTRSVSIQEGSQVSQVSGQEIFAGGGGGVDTFAIMDELHAAVIAGDHEAVIELLDDLETSSAQIGTGMQHIGNQLGLLEHSRNFGEMLLIRNSVAESPYADTDYAETISRLELASTVLQITARAASSGPQTSALFRL